MNRAAELLIVWRIGIVRAGISVVWLMTVRTPVPLVFAGVCIEHDHSLITVPVGDVQFIGFGIHPHFGRSSKICHVVAAFARSCLSNLH